MLSAIARHTRRHTVISRSLAARASLSYSAPARADPWPLPHTPEHLEKTRTPTDVPMLPPLERIGESVDKMRARLVYQSRKRGTLESDLLLSTFARDHLAMMSEAEMREYDKLLDEPDWDIYYWATGKRAPPERWEDSVLLQKLAMHAKNEGKVVRKMPALD
ncbi:Flavinator of succinate dehydrogenase-domain-containing protein [Schizophyllum amplum]|uniref:Succinate dehydrogenase assembly factor 2, mitochondrial n=1 Tax=Schizophyllum amplum TaxID=97359 RepID=A0A550CFP0_9AGAR|nr:Flavinator of succinate dehydrogenase-domain-containing protein [Auriculariopsis ampla]